MKPIGSSLAAAALALLAGGVMTGPALAAEPAAPVAPPGLPYGAPITLEQARIVVAAAEAEAKKRGVSIALAVVDSGGNLVFAERMNGVSLASGETVILKAKSAVVWQRPTSYWVQAIAASHGAQATFPDVYAGAGGEMIVTGGRIVGGVGVGGSGPNEADISRIAAAALN